MPSILLVTTDSIAISKIEQLEVSKQFRTRIVSNAQSAKEWLNLESFDVILVDSYSNNSDYNNQNAIEIATLGWRFNQFMTCVFFNIYGPVANEWQARLIGTHIASGATSLETISKILTLVPQSTKETKEKQVMLVEDLDSPRFIISSYIDALGYGKVEALNSAHKALEMLNSDVKRFFCIVTDINMPEISGIELIEKVRANPKLKHLPIVVLTSYATVDNLIDCVRAGASGFLVKPPKKGTLRQELDKALRIMATGQSPRLCKPEDAHLLQDALTDLTLI